MFRQHNRILPQHADTSLSFPAWSLAEWKGQARQGEELWAFGGGPPVQGLVWQNQIYSTQWLVHLLWAHSLLLCRQTSSQVNRQALTHSF